MTNLNEIVSVFSTEEHQAFLNYLKKKNKRSDTKNIQLFKLLYQNELTSKEICIKIYNTEKKDAYHALRKRLYQSIIDFISNRNLSEENSIDIQIIRYILTSRYFLIHKHFKTAYKILDKAEVLAEEHQLFTILSEIYHTKIQYAYANETIEIDSLITKFKEYQQKHYLEEELNIAYAKIRKVLSSINNKGEIIDFQTIIENILKEHKVDFRDAISFKSLYQLITIVGVSTFATNDYLKIEPFLLNNYKLLDSEKLNEKQIYYHLEVLYNIANTLFRNKKFEESIYYLNRMHTNMLLHKKKYYNNFKLKYNLLLSLNHNYNNHQETAINLLIPFVSKKHSDFDSLLDIYLSLIVFYFQKRDLKNANQLFSKFYHTDKWYIKKAGIEWTIKKNLIEILLHLELNNIDIFESRILSFKRNFYPFLKSIQQERVITYLSLIEYYYKNPETITSPAFKDKVENSFQWVSNKKEDIFVMSFYAFLKSKMEQKPIYETTIALVEIARN